MADNRVLIITGMHRSGTSVTTRWLQECGLHIGDELMGTETGNEDGHFEDMDFLQAHQLILQGRQLRDEGYCAPLPQLTPQEKEMLRDILQEKNARNQQWGWKDPRTCLFLNTYQELVPQAYYLVILRDYQSVVSSLVYRIYKRSEKKYSTKTGLPKFIWEHFKKKYRLKKLLRKYATQYIKVWIWYNEAIAAHLRNISPDHYLVVDFTRLPQVDHEVYHELSTHWGFSLHPVRYGSLFKTQRIHQPADIDRYVRNKSLIQKAAELEAALRKMTAF